MQQYFHDIATNINICYSVQYGKKKLHVDETFYMGTSTQPDMRMYGFVSGKQWEEFLLEAIYEEAV